MVARQGVLLIWSLLLQIMEQPCAPEALPSSKKRRLTFVKKDTIPIAEKLDTATGTSAQSLSDEVAILAAAAAKSAADD